MKERLQELLKQEHLTPVRFAELVDVQRSSVSHVLSGRNKPSLDFIGKILSAFTHVNPDWLILGEGNYRRGHKEKGDVVKDKPAAPFSGALARSGSKESLREEDPAAYGQKGLFGAPFEATPVDVAPAPDKSATPRPEVIGDKSAKRVVKMVFFYCDNTFEVFYPGNGG